MWQNSKSRQILQAVAPKDMQKQLRGAMSREQGLLFERMIEQACDYYRTKGIADIEKTPEPMQPVKDLGNGRFIAHYVKAAQADFKGTLRGGRSINFEAKFTSSGKIEQTRVTPDQTDRLERTEALGGLSFVLCGFIGGMVYRVPWAVWRDLKGHYGHKYITVSEADPYRIRIGGPGVPLFLEGLEKTSCSL